VKLYTLKFTHVSIHILFYADLLQSGPKDELSSAEPDMAVEEHLKESAAPTDMLQSAEMLPCHQLLSEVDMEQPVTTSVLLEVNPYVQQLCFDVS